MPAIGCQMAVVAVSTRGVGVVDFSVVGLIEGREGSERIGRMARAALERIGKESTVNAIRVQRFGVTIGETAANAPEKAV